MSLKGDLTTFSLADIFQTLSLSQKEGTLYVVNGERRKTIYFGRGGLRLLQVGARATPLLGDLLVRSGALTQGLLESALKHKQATGKRLGEVLVELGFVTQEQLDRVVRTQIEEEVYDLFWWKDAAFEFQEGPPPSELLDPTSPVTSLQMDVNGLLFEAARRLDEWARMVQVIADFQEVYATGGRALGEINKGTIKDAGEIEVLKLTDGSRSVLEVISASTLGRFETCRILYQAIGEGKVFTAATDELMAAAQKLREANEKDRALRMARRALDRSPEDLNCLRTTATLEIETGDLAGACTHLRTASDLAERGQNPAMAVQFLEQALKCEPSSLDVQSGLFKRYGNLGQKDKAGKMVVPLIQGLIAAGRFQEATEHYKEALAFAPDRLDIHILQARSLIELENRDGAIEVLANAYQDGPADQKNRLDIIMKRVQALAPQAAELHTLAKGTKVRRRKASGKKPLLPVAIGGAVVLVLGIGAFAIFHKGGPAPTVGNVPVITEEEKAAQLLADQKKRETEEREKREREEAAKVAKAKEDREKREQEERERHEREDREAKEKAARDEAERREIAAEQIKFREAAALEMSGPDIELALKGFVEVQDWAQKKEGQEDLLRQARSHVESIQRMLEESRTLAGRIAEELKAGNVEEAYRLVHRLWKEYPFTPVARATTLPIRIVSFPPGASVKLGKTEVGKSPVVLALPFKSAQAALWVESPGFLPAKADVSPASPPLLTFPLEKVVAWRFRSRGPIEARSVVAGDRVFVGSRDGRVYALSLAKGEPLWTFNADTAGDILSAPVLYGDSLYFGSNDHRLYRVGIEDGKEKWRYETELFVQGSPLVLDDPAVVLVGGHDKKLHCVKRETGERLWTAAAEGAVTARPFLYGGFAVFGSEDGKLRAVELTKGKVQWDVACGSEIVAAPAADGDRAYVATKGGALLCVDLREHRILWTIQAGSGIVGPPALIKDTVIVGTLGGMVTALRREDGQTVWTFNAEGAVTGGVAVGGNRVYFGSRDGNIYVLESSSGALYWKVKTRGPVNSAPLLHEGTLLIGSDDGQLYAIGVQ